MHQALPHSWVCPGSDTSRGKSGVKVVFLDTVEGSGTAGEVKDVANGYARNLPVATRLGRAGDAAPAPASGRRSPLRRRSGNVNEDERAQKLVGKLQGQTLVMAVRVGEQGRLYGSVTNADIAEKAGEILGEELDRRRVLLPEVIRQVGVSTVPVRLSRNVTAEVQVVVVDVEAPEGVDAAVEALLAPPAEPEPQVIDTPSVAGTGGAAQTLVEAAMAAEVSESGLSSPAPSDSAAPTEDAADAAPAAGDDASSDADPEEAPAGS